MMESDVNHIYLAQMAEYGILHYHNVYVHSMDFGMVHNVLYVVQESYITMEDVSVQQEHSMMEINVKYKQ